jgi:anti-anti-sigma regulatory factor/anti-sigma regulatory factor (Ser/Thr protein kinase)
VNQLTCTQELPPPITVFSVVGRLDLTTAAQVRAALHKALAEEPDVVVLDLDGLTVADDVALTVFAAFSRAAAAWPGCPVVLCAHDSAVVADLTRMSVSRVMPVYPDRATAVLAAKQRPAPRRFATRLEGTATAAGTAREIVAQACETWRLPHVVDDAQLIITELVSNAVRHAKGGLHLLMLLRDRHLHLSIADASGKQPRRILPDPDTGEGGRGLLLVETVAAAWGTSPTPGGKVVWATLRVHR